LKDGSHIDWRRADRLNAAPSRRPNAQRRETGRTAAGRRLSAWFRFGRFSATLRHGRDRRDVSAASRMAGTAFIDTQESIMKTFLRSLYVALCAAGSLAGVPAVLAQSAAPGTDARMQRERAVCDGVQQDRAACLREAGAARQEAQRNGLSSASPIAYDQNALARCQLQPVADRADCEARVKGTGMSSTEGSVMGGGVIREKTTPIPAPVPAR
jgi:hypothetical protein